MLRNGKSYDPSNMNGMEVIDANIVRHVGMTRIASENKTDFQILLEASPGKTENGDTDLIDQLFDIPTLRKKKSDRLRHSTDQAILDANNDNFKRFFESLLAKKLLTHVLNSEYIKEISLFIKELTTFFSKEYKQYNPDFLNLWEKAKNGGEIKDNDSDLFTYSVFKPDLVNLIKENHFKSKVAETLIDLYDLHYLTHPVSTLPSYKIRHPKGLVETYKTHGLFSKKNRGRLIGFGFSKDNPSYNLGTLRSIDQAPHDMKKSVLTSKTTRCPDRLYMEHPKIARENKKSWLHHCFSNGYNSGYVNGLSGSMILEIRSVLFFISSVMNNKYECSFIQRNSLFDHDYALLKNYFRLVLGMFVYIEGGHTISEILSVFELKKVFHEINTILKKCSEKNILSVKSLLTDNENTRLLVKEALMETKQFYLIRQQKLKLHTEIKELSQIDTQGIIHAILPIYIALKKSLEGKKISISMICLMIAYLKTPEKMEPATLYPPRICCAK